MAGGVTPGAWLAMAALWQAMMVAMMAPTAYPWLRAAARMGGGERAPALHFGAGYFAAWVPFSLLLAGAQLALAARLTTTAWLGGLLLAAGLYQFAPLKRACLRHCRNPMGAWLARWPAPPLWRLGAEHGWFCLGCCWALMATALGAGMSNWAWMALLAALTFAEQTLPHTGWLRPLLGMGFILAGGALVWAKL